MDSSGHVGIWIHTINDGGSTMSSNASLNANQTYHVVATYDGTARCIYINGNVDACSPETGAITGYNWSSGLAIGGGYEFSDGAYPGIVAGVALYSKVLSPNQIVAHYHAGLVPTGITPVPTGPTPTPTNTPVTNPTTTPGTTPRVSPGNSFTGINPWWTFEEAAIPGVGKYLANVGTGLNLLVQADDMAIPNRGIELAFRRTYNSESGHDLSGDDGGPSGNYGAGWTNTFDAGIAYNSGNGNGIGLSIFDIDGARYDYVPDGAGNWIPPAGQHAQLRWDGANGYFWTKKTGTTYYFFSSALASDPRYAGVAGRVDIIWGRNQNNRLDFYYSFSDPSATSAATLTTLDVVTDSTGSTARHAVVTFADFNGKRLARSLQWPNGQLVTYSYDTAEHLIEVDEPPNSTSTTSCQGVPSCLPQAYQYYAGTNLMQWAAGPRWMISGATDGGYEAFRYYNAGGIAEVDDVGNVNPSIGDGYSSGPIQTNGPNTSSYYTYRQVLFDVSGSTTLWHDTDGHETDYTYDGLARVTQRQEHTGLQLLTSTQGWDGENNLSYETDFRANRTDYAYDANGNTVVAAKSAVANANGNFRPTNYYSYDSFNNVVAYCDPVQSHLLGKDYPASPTSTSPASDTLCPQQAGSTRMVWTPTAAEPYGELHSIVYPLGNTALYAYDPNAQGGTDFGLPTQVTTDTFQQADGTTVTPSQAFSYNVNGDLTGYSKGFGSWKLTYDGIGRLATAVDPDGVPTDTKTYDADGAVQSDQTAAEKAAGVNTSSLYDADGNVISETKHFGCTTASSCSPGTTRKWYDGADRLVEVNLPADPHLDSGLPQLTRYFYDLSMGGAALSIAQSHMFAAHGNLFKTQEFFGNSVGNPPPTWNDVTASAFDSLDRLTEKFAFAPGDAVIHSNIWTYDSGANSYGFLAATRDPLGQQSNLTYDNDGNVTNIAFAGDSGVTPARSVLYDEDGRKKAITSVYGTQSYDYDQNGRVVRSTEAAGGGVTSPATFLYDYYPNGWRQDLRILSAPAPLAAGQQTLLTYAYRSDSETSKVSMPAYNQFIAKTYTPSGRLASRTDSLMNTTQSGVPIIADTYSYDQYGQMSGHQFPHGGTLSNFSSDDEGEPAGYTATDYTYQRVTYPGPTPAPAVVRFGHTAQGQLAGTFVTGGVPSGAENGDSAGQLNYIRGLPSPCFGLPTAACSSTVDKTVGAILGTRKLMHCGKDPSQPTKYYNTSAYSYDAAGRRTSKNDTTYDADCSQGADSTTMSYDAENHTIGVSPDGPDTSNLVTTLEWGPNGHPIRSSEKYTAGTTPLAPTVLSEHWDGDKLLFTTDSNGTLNDFLIGDDEDLLFFSSSTIYKNMQVRDSSGTVVLTYNAGGTSDWNVGPTYYSPQKGWATASADFPGKGAGVYAPGPINARTDGYLIGDVIIQGVRSYDPGTLQWTTPDAYAGNVHDPISQKPYVWNRDNPIAYADPTGFDSLGPKLDVGSLEIGNILSNARARSNLRGNSRIAIPGNEKTAV